MSHTLKYFIGHYLFFPILFNPVLVPDYFLSNVFCLFVCVNTCFVCLCKHFALTIIGELKST